MTKSAWVSSASKIRECSGLRLKRGSGQIQGKFRGGSTQVPSRMLQPIQPDIAVYFGVVAIVHS